MKVPSALDHIVLTVPDLESGVAEFTELTGAVPVFGGSHPGRGTANFLVGLQPEGYADGALSYIEILGPDPKQESQGELALDAHLATGLTLQTWVVHPLDFDAQVARARQAGIDFGEVAPMSRNTPEGEELQWRLTRRSPLPHGGAQPFLIDWGASRHPARSLDADIVLTSLTLTAPTEAQGKDMLAALGATTAVVEGPRWGFSITGRGPAGEFELTSPVRT